MNDNDNDDNCKPLPCNPSAETTSPAPDLVLSKPICPRVLLPWMSCFSQAHVGTSRKPVPVSVPTSPVQRTKLNKHLPSSTTGAN